MKYYFVTGSSKGLGKAFVEEALKDSESRVFGLSRTNSLDEANFTFCQLDLSNSEEVESFSFPKLSKVDEIILVNNAGIIGDIKPIGRKNPRKIFDTFQVNTIAPAVLMNQFVRQFQSLEADKIILNISSGAGRHTINSWAEYCASKSAMDMCSLVFAEEQKLEPYPVKVYSIAPGVVDTGMQTEIRLSKKEDFEKLDYFIDLKRNNLLSFPSEVAKQLMRILKNQNSYNEVIMDIRDSS